MAKLMIMLIIMIVIQFCLILYGGGDTTGNTLWEIAVNPQNWNNATFITGIVALAGSLALAGIFAGQTFGFITDFIVFSSAVYGLLAMGAVFFVNFASKINGDLFTFFQCIPGAACDPATAITAVTVGTFAVIYIFVVLEWWRGRDA